MKDREMLEIAARASCLPHQWNTFWNGMYIHNFDEENGEWWDSNSYWNPFTNSARALELAIEQGISIVFTDCQDSASIVIAKYFGGEITRRNFPDPIKETRRAIVEAVVQQQIQLEETNHG